MFRLDFDRVPVPLSRYHPSYSGPPTCHSIEQVLALGLHYPNSRKHTRQDRYPSTHILQDNLDRSVILKGHIRKPSTLHMTVG